MTMPNGNGRALHLTFVVAAPGELSPTDFLGLFECVDSFSRHVVEHEALQLFDELDLPSEWRLATLQDIRRVGRRVSAPGEIARVHRGSWEIETILQGAALLWFVRSYLNPVVQDAWNDSRLRQVIVEFLRNRIFGGAKRALEQKAVQSPRYRTLEVSRVDEPEPGTAEEAGIRITLERREVLEARLSDHELVNDFLQRIRGQRR